MMAQVRVDGVWMSTIAPWGDLTWAHDAYGCKEASWGAYFKPGERHPALTGRPLVEVVEASQPIWSGELAEADWVEGTFTAMGVAYGAERYLALDGLGDATSNPTTAANRATTAGWNLAGLDGVPNTDYLAAVDGASTCGALFDANADELGQWWTVKADRVLRFSDAPATPTWQLRRGLLAMGNTDDDYASAVAVVYLDSATSTYLKVIRVDTEAADRFGYREHAVDATVVGPISTAKAEAIGDGLLLKGRSRLGWTDSIEVTAEDLLTIGGVPGDLSMVESHQLMRVFVDSDDVQFLGGRTYLDLVIGSSSYAGGAVARIAPLGGTPQTVAEAFEEIYNLAAGKAA